MIVEAVIEQHAEEAACLWLLRRRNIEAPHFKLKNLGAFDARLDAHFDGLLGAGEEVWPICEQEMARGGAAEIFVAAVLALEPEHEGRLDGLLALVDRTPALAPGVVSALGWSSHADVAARVAEELARATQPERRRLGIAAAAARRMDLGGLLAAAIDDERADVRARALRAAGELGRGDLRAACRARLDDGDDACRFWAAWAAVRLGARDAALDALVGFARSEAAFAGRALALALRALPMGAALGVVAAIEHDAGAWRAARAAGIAGDPARVPWLIHQMWSPRTARAAGEAFTSITGVELGPAGLASQPPEGFASGPTDDPDDPNVALDPDEDLEWPHVHAVAAWWQEHGGRFAPGVAHLAGAPLRAETAVDVIRDGFLRQRIGAALHLALLRPDAQLLEWRAPVAKQRAQVVALAGAAG